MLNGSDWGRVNEPTSHYCINVFGGDTWMCVYGSWGQLMFFRLFLIFVSIFLSISFKYALNMFLIYKNLKISFSWHIRIKRFYPINKKLCQQPERVSFHRAVWDKRLCKSGSESSLLVDNFYKKNDFVVLLVFWNFMFNIENEAVSTKRAETSNKIQWNKT